MSYFFRDSLKFSLLIFTIIVTIQSDARETSDQSIQLLQVTDSSKLLTQGKDAVVHYRVSESESNRQVTFDPIRDIESATQNLFEKTKEYFELMQFEEYSGQMPNPDEPYKREKHFGRWIRDPRTPKDCRNIRSKVLERDSLGPVQMTNDGCVVIRGEWLDPYGGRTYTDSRDIQIDHFVPLKNAYISGGYRWSRQEKCLYANYMGNDFHLIAVDGVENNQKSDSTPEKYLPSQKSYRCQYLSQWLKVKLIWSLALSQSEVDSIRRLVKENQCQQQDFKYHRVELHQQRRFRQQNLDLCSQF